MSITIEAVYEDGVLKPQQPLPFKEHEKVRVTIDEEAEWRCSRVRATAGLLGWKGDAETVERIALDPEFGGNPILDAYGLLGWSGDAQTLERFALDPEFDPQEDE